MFWEKLRKCKLIKYPEGENPEAFIYKWTHVKTGMWYLGYHGLKENEGMYDGVYKHSSKNQQFIDLLNNEPEEFDYEQLYYGTIHEMIVKEHELLTKMRDSKKKRAKSFNYWNGIAPEPIAFPNLKLIDKWADDAYDKDSNLEREEVPLLDLKDIIKLQVRFVTAESHTKIREYRLQMENQNSTKGFTLTIVRTKCGKMILAGGNHTLEAVQKAGFSSIEVVFIDVDEMDMVTLLALGDALNRKKEVRRMTTAMEDVATKLVGLLDMKKIPDLKCQNATNYIRVTGGFVGSDITKVRRIAEKMMKEKDSWLPQKTWKSWKLKKHQEEAEQEVAALMSDSTYACYMSAKAFNSSRIQENWLRDFDLRNQKGLPVRNIVKILLHWPTNLDYTEYNKTKVEVQKMHKRCIGNVMGHEGVDDPVIIFEELNQWEDQYKNAA